MIAADEDLDEYSDDGPHLDDADCENVPGIDEEWKTVLSTTLSNPDTIHEFDAILTIAYQHLIYEELDELNALLDKHARKERLEDEESATLSNAMVVKSYIQEKFAGKTQVTNAEALNILNHDLYDKWMDNMPDEIISKIDQFMPDEEKADL